MEWIPLRALNIKLIQNWLSRLASIIQDTRCSEHQPESQTPLVRYAVHHRIGVVPVGEPSIVIGVSSPHRKLS
ncbi:hypothetical protein EV421DRAFT_1804852 [Armillaria borealis]|uniref:Uncharacterized protein n=1 Tax=Armillaria borealis TaxID=47425 RepID=A0AA39JJ51_9AGAR|nr:hypothetical protein EV421DRAFT_1804852 [Armillaria borealis]